MNSGAKPPATWRIRADRCELGNMDSTIELCMLHERNMRFQHGRLGLEAACGVAVVRRVTALRRTVRYLGVEIEDALSIAEKIEI